MSNWNRVGAAFVYNGREISGIKLTRAERGFALRKIDARRPHVHISLRGVSIEGVDNPEPGELGVIVGTIVDDDTVMLALPSVIGGSDRRFFRNPSPITHAAHGGSEIITAVSAIPLIIRRHRTCDTTIWPKNSTRAAFGGVANTGITRRSTVGRPEFVLAFRKKGEKARALSESALDRLLAAKRDGRLDVAKVVAVRIDHTGETFYDDEVDAERLDSNDLNGKPGDGVFTLSPWVMEGRSKKIINLPPAVPADEQAPF